MGVNSAAVSLGVCRPRVKSSDVLGWEVMNVPPQLRIYPCSICLLDLDRILKDWWCPPTVMRLNLCVCSLLVQMLVSSRDALTDKFRKIFYQLPRYLLTQLCWNKINQYRIHHGYHFFKYFSCIHPTVCVTVRTPVVLDHHCQLACWS